MLWDTDLSRLLSAQYRNHFKSAGSSGAWLEQRA